MSAALITVPLLRALQSEAGSALLAALATADLSEANALRLLTDLRKRVPGDLAAAALETARLRVKGRLKFGERADRMFFVRPALEQATDSRVSVARFADWHGAGWAALEFGCGIGGDTLTLCDHFARVTAFELDPTRITMARWNVAAHIGFVRADLTAPLPIRRLGNQPTLGFFDPARRSEERRAFSIHDYAPPLTLIDHWRQDRGLFDVASIKLSPGVDLDELRDALPRYLDHGRLRFLSLDGDLKEANLVYAGDESAPPTREALVIHADGTTDTLIRSVPAIYDGLAVRAPRGWLYEPDPAVIRAGLVQDLGVLLGAAQIDPTIAFLSADHAVETPYARHWQVLDWFPFNLKKLKAYLRERGVGRLTVKKRGSPITPEELIAKLKPDGAGEERVIVLTHVGGVPAVIICAGWGTSTA